MIVLTKASKEKFNYIKEKEAAISLIRIDSNEKISTDTLLCIEEYDNDKPTGRAILAGVESITKTDKERIYDITFSYIDSFN